MSKQIRVSFQLKLNKKNKAGEAPIYVRILVNQSRTEFSSKRYIHPAKWIAGAGMVKGTTEDAKIINHYLNTVRTDIMACFNQLTDTGKPITCETVKNAYLGIEEKGKTIVEAFTYHNEQLKTLIGIDYAAGTYERYATALRHVKEFIRHRYKVSDMELKQVNPAFITEFEFYLKTIRKCAHNSALKYIANFKKIILQAINNSWIDKNPFHSYKFRLQEVEREYLTQDEINRIAEKKFPVQRLEQVRDIFLFSCYTGLAYADIKKLSPHNIVKGIDRRDWIKIKRTKTDTPSTIPVLPVAFSLIEKYRDNIICINSGKIFPVPSNQKMNAYLKEIADICGITKKITCHLARHTFATTVTLANSIPIESVSKMLGHRSVKQTEHYAKVTEFKIARDISPLYDTFSDNRKHG